MNAASIYLARLPLEIRREVYKLVLGSGTVFHIVDESAAVKPNFSYGTGTDEHDAGRDGSVSTWEEVKLREDWEDVLEDTVDAQYEASEKTRLRAVSIPASNPHSSDPRGLQPIQRGSHIYLLQQQQIQTPQWYRRFLHCSPISELAFASNAQMHHLLRRGRIATLHKGWARTLWQQVADL